MTNAVSAMATKVDGITFAAISSLSYLYRLLSCTSEHNQLTFARYTRATKPRGRGIITENADQGCLVRIKSQLAIYVIGVHPLARKVMQALQQKWIFLLWRRLRPAIRRTS
ncbi:hypothetical protein Plhal304r1_c044g0124941 [Plasmopara halstedii]